MNCLFHDYCINTNGYPKPDCHAANQDVSSHACGNHFDISNIVSREGKQFGYEMTSTWLSNKLIGKGFPAQSLYITLAYIKLLERLNKRLESDTALNSDSEYVFLHIARPTLLDTCIVRGLSQLAKTLTRFNKVLVIIFDSQYVDISQYTKQAEFHLYDAGVKFCQRSSLSTHLINMQSVDFLMYSAVELENIVKSDVQSTADTLFSLSERGFQLVLNDVFSPESYSLGLSLPFMFFKP